jgi:hypothetical protein
MRVLTLSAHLRLFLIFEHTDLSMITSWHEVCLLFNKSERSVKEMSERQKADITPEQEKELINILIDSNLYLEMDLDERRDLLNFLAKSYSLSPFK